MILGLVCAAGEVVSILKRLVKQHGELLSVHADGADEARIEAQSSVISPGWTSSPR